MSCLPRPLALAGLWLVALLLAVLLAGTARAHELQPGYLELRETAPAKTTPATVQQLNTAVNKALATPELRERFAKLGLEPTGGSAADLAVLMKRDGERWAPVVKASGFKGD